MEAAEESQTGSDVDDDSDGSDEGMGNDAVLYNLCLQLLLSCNNLTMVKVAMESTVGDLRSFFALVLKGPNSRKRYDRIEFLLGRAVCQEWEARGSLFNCLPAHSESGRLEECLPDDSFTVSLQLLNSGLSLSSVMQLGRLPVLIGNIARGPNPEIRQNMLKALASQAYDSHNRSLCEIHSSLRETFGMCDECVGTGQRAGLCERAEQLL